MWKLKIKLWISASHGWLEWDLTCYTVRSRSGPPTHTPRGEPLITWLWKNFKYVGFSWNEFSQNSQVCIKTGVILEPDTEPPRGHAETSLCRTLRSPKGHYYVLLLCMVLSDSNSGKNRCARAEYHQVIHNAETPENWPKFQKCAVSTFFAVTRHDRRCCCMKCSLVAIKPGDSYAE